MEFDFVLRIAAVGIITALLSQLLTRAGREELGFLTTMAGVVVVLALLVSKAERLFDTIRRLLGN